MCIYSFNEKETSVDKPQLDKDSINNKIKYAEMFQLLSPCTYGLDMSLQVQRDREPAS